MIASDPMPSRRPLLIFAKAPVPGKVKTRLIPALGAEGGCALYQRLLEHCLLQTADWPGERLLYVDQPSHVWLKVLAAEHGLPVRRQVEGDLGERMMSAMADFPGGALLIGSDCPALDTQAIARAAAALQSHDTAIIPSDDGGYVLIGQRQPHPAPFEQMQWSHAKVMADTRQRLHRAGLSLWEGEPLWDLDEPADLPRLPPALARALRTGRVSR